MNIHAYIYIYMYTCIHTYIHTYIHTLILYIHQFYTYITYIHYIHTKCVYIYIYIYIYICTFNIPQRDVGNHFGLQSAPGFPLKTRYMRSLLATGWGTPNTSACCGRGWVNLLGLSSLWPCLFALCIPRGSAHIALTIYTYLLINLFVHFSIHICICICIYLHVHTGALKRLRYHSFGISVYTIKPHGAFGIGAMVPESRKSHAQNCLSGQP